jgi:hypothetical protein
MHDAHLSVKRRMPILPLSRTIITTNSTPQVLVRGPARPDPFRQHGEPPRRTDGPSFMVFTTQSPLIPLRGRNSCPHPVPFQAFDFIRARAPYPFSFCARRPARFSVAPCASCRSSPLAVGLVRTR